MTLSFEIPDEIYGWIKDLAVKMGKPVETVALEYLLRMQPAPLPQLTEEERRQAQERMRRHSGSVSSGDPHSADNDRIDADLARAYADNHEEAS